MHSHFLSLFLSNTIKIHSLVTCALCVATDHPLTALSSVHVATDHFLYDLSVTVLPSMQCMLLLTNVCISIYFIKCARCVVTIDHSLHQSLPCQVCKVCSFWLFLLSVCVASDHSISPWGAKCVLLLTILSSSHCPDKCVCCYWPFYQSLPCQVCVCVASDHAISHCQANCAYCFWPFSLSVTALPTVCCFWPFYQSLPRQMCVLLLSLCQTLPCQVCVATDHSLYQTLPWQMCVLLLTILSISPAKHQKASTSFSITTKTGDSRSLMPCTYPGAAPHITLKPSCSTGHLSSILLMTSLLFLVLLTLIYFICLQLIVG